MRVMASLVQRILDALRRQPALRRLPVAVRLDTRIAGRRVF